MSYLGTFHIDDYVGIPAATHRFSSGAAYVPTVLTYSIYEEATAVGIDEDVDMVVASPFDSVTGCYWVRRQLTTAAGFEAGKNYLVVVKATVDSVAAIQMHTFQVEATPGATGGVAIVGSAMTLADDAITAAKIAADAITSSELAASATAEIAAAAWAYASRTLTSTAAATVSAVSGSTLNVTIAATYAATLSGMTISATWAKIWLTAKTDLAQADSAAVLQILVTNPADAVADGLLYLEGAANATKTNGSLTVSQAAGTVAIVILDEATDDLSTHQALEYDVKQLDAAGATTVLTAGMLNVSGTPTKAVA